MPSVKSEFIPFTSVFLKDNKFLNMGRTISYYSPPILNIPRSDMSNIATKSDQSFNM